MSRSSPDRVVRDFLQARLTVLIATIAAVVVSVVWPWGSASTSHQAVSGPEQGLYFHQSDCEKCAAAEKWVRAFAAEHPGRQFTRLDMQRLDTLLIRRRYDTAYAVPESQRLQVPALFVDGEAYIGVDAIRDFVEGKGKATRSPFQRAADRYGPMVLRWLLAAALIGLAVSGATGGRGQWFIRSAARVFLGSVLVVSAVSKGTHLQATAQGFSEQWPLLQGSAPPLLAGVAAVEAITGLALLLGRPRRLARFGPPALFGLFLLYAIAAQAFRVSGDCGCFPWREGLGWSTVARNLGFVFLSWLLIAAPVPPTAAPIGEAQCTST